MTQRNLFDDEEFTQKWMRSVKKHLKERGVCAKAQGQEGAVALAVQKKRSEC